MHFDDVALLGKCKTGDLKSFETLVNVHRNFAIRVAFGILFDEDDAREAAHECFIKIWKNIKDYKPEMKFTTWLYKIIVNICYDKIKMKKRSLSIMFPATDDDSKIKFETSSNIEENLANNEIVGLIKKYAALLPEKQRMVFALRDIEELSVNEVSQILKISPGSVKTNLLFARRTIANKIKKLENYGTHKDEM